MTITKQGGKGRDTEIVCSFSTPKLNKAIADCPDHMKHLVPIMSAIRDYNLVSLFFRKGVKLAPHPRRYRKRPMVVIIEDDVSASMGPKAFHRKSLRKVMNSAGNIFLHCIEPLPEHYELAVEGALATGRTVVIETQPSRESAWLAYIYKHNPSVKLSIFTAAPLKYSQQSGRA